MGLKGSIAGVLIAVAVAIATGCGSSSSSDSNAGEAEASKAFHNPKGKEIVNFGEEASSEEREAASAVLEENYEARAAADWAGQCSSLTKGERKRLEEAEAYRNVGKGCTEALKYAAAPAPATKAVRENTLTGPIDALRVKGDQAWALYHGKGGKDYAMPMEKEGNEWKVNNTTTTELPK
jgi:hypothetical protein